MRIKEIFKQTRRQNHTLFIPFIMCGYPNLETTFNLIMAMQKLNVAAIELGVPFSDPVADGVVNQAAAYHAVKNNVSLNDCLQLVSRLRHNNMTLPIILYSYFNPIFKYGILEFAQVAKQVGINAVLLVDLPLEELLHLQSILIQYDLELIVLTTPTTNLKRLKIINKINPAFVYHTTRNSVTGMQEKLSVNLNAEIKNLRAATNLPIAAGVGISTREHVAQLVSMGIDAVIIGSALMNELMQHENNIEHQFLKTATQLIEPTLRSI